MIELLKTDTKAWNDWRRQNPDDKIDLSGTDFLEEDLRGVLLDNADLTHCNLVGVNFIKASLRNAKFHYSKVFFANFGFADLTNADFTDAKTRNARFNRCILTNVKGLSVYSDLDRLFLDNYEKRQKELFGK